MYPLIDLSREELKQLSKSKLLEIEIEMSYINNIYDDLKDYYEIRYLIHQTVYLCAFIACLQYANSKENRNIL